MKVEIVPRRCAQEKERNLRRQSCGRNRNQRRPEQRLMHRPIGRLPRIHFCQTFSQASPRSPQNSTAGTNDSKNFHSLP
jgi:hypothetical protein